MAAAAAAVVVAKVATQSTANSEQPPRLGLLQPAMAMREQTTHN